MIEDGARAALADLKASRPTTPAGRARSRVELATPDHTEQFRHHPAVDIADPRTIVSRGPDWWTAWRQFYFSFRWPELMPREYPTVLDLIGGTPLVRLQRVARDVEPTVVAKLEYMNPGGSVKDRIGLRMIEAAEREGLLRARRHDRRADLGQHRRRPRHRRRASSGYR